MGGPSYDPPAEDHSPEGGKGGGGGGAEPGPGATQTPRICGQKIAGGGLGGRGGYGVVARAEEGGGGGGGGLCGTQQFLCLRHRRPRSGGPCRTGASAFGGSLALAPRDVGPPCTLRRCVLRRSRSVVAPPPPPPPLDTRPPFKGALDAHA